MNDSRSLTTVLGRLTILVLAGCASCAPAKPASTLLPCSQGAVSEVCTCGGGSVIGGFCCDDVPQTSACALPACADGAVTSPCLCGGTAVASAFCCSGASEGGACNLTRLRLDGGLAAGTSTYDGKRFVPLLPYLTSGEAFDSTLDTPGTPIANTEFDGLYRDETWVNSSSATFTIPVENGAYSVHLHFVDWEANSTTVAGDRLFHVDIQGVREFTDLDIIAEVGTDAALVKSRDIAVTDGGVTITFTNHVYYAEIAAIEILPQGESFLGHVGCVGPSTRACAIENGTGSQSATCAGTTWTWGTCTVAACNNGYVQSGNTCVPGQTVCGTADGVCPPGCTSAQDVDCAQDLPADYYISADGDDGADGTTRTTPWRTISKFNAESQAGRFIAGNRVAFRRGDTFSGTLVVASSGASGAPITVSAYGTGAAPIINGFTTVTGWTSEGNGVYSAAVAGESTPNVVTVDGVNTAMGRWPDDGSANAGWALTAAWNSTSSLTDAALSSFSNLAGATIVAKRDRWLLSRSAIISHNGSTIDFDTLYGYSSMDSGKGYFIQNHIDTLTKFGEWCYANGTLHMYFGSESPGSHVVNMGARDYLITINGQHDVVIDGLHLQGANNNAVDMSGTSYVTIQQCAIDFSGQRGIYSDSAASTCTVQHNVINNSNDGGIYLSSSTNAVIQYNSIGYSGYLQGMGIASDNGYEGITATGDGTLITYNSITNNGGMGIRFGGDGSVVSHNLVDTHNIWTADGAGIYSFHGATEHRTVDHNISINGVCEPYGWTYWEDNVAHGLYLDGADYVTVTDNVLAQNHGAGMFINCNRNDVISGNLSYGNLGAGIQLTSFDPENAAGLDRRNNVFFATEADELVWYEIVQNGTEELGNFGSSDYNYFVRPMNNTDYILASTYKWSGQSLYYDLAGWQSAYGKEQHSSATPMTVSTTADLRFEYNATDSDKIVPLGGSSYMDATGRTYSGSVTLAAWTGIALMKY